MTVIQRVIRYQIIALGGLLSFFGLGRTDPVGGIVGMIVALGCLGLSVVYSSKAIEIQIERFSREITEIQRYD